MKTTTASTLVVAALAGLASAQQLPKFSLPNCASCISNMLALHMHLGCQQPDDIYCLCSKPDFNYGIHDCAVESCENIEQAEWVISEGKNICGRARPVATTASKTLEGVEVIFTSSGRILETSTALIGTVTPTPPSSSGVVTGKFNPVTSSLASLSTLLASLASTSASMEGKQQEPSATVTEVSGTPVGTATGTVTSSSQSAAGAVITAGLSLGLVGGLAGFLL
ncbi:hypothetical protein QC764_100543 [Podospora pseudoanserina]|uniref:CFEM domain-containing protein n=1 Tax=Podospora pseudoanserina TaxID=2609844 RepID=A0ABR0IKI5_9PEZI|nr:hypothetical protein QC764_100543 [Podospora pseudoanserina]